MKTVKVKDVYVNPVKYQGCMNDKCKKSQKRGCECGLGYHEITFDSFKVLGEDGEYYRLSGFGANRVKEGDEISGELTTTAWESNGKKGVNNDLKLPKVEEQQQLEIDRLKAELIEAQAIDKAGKKTVTADEAPPHTDEDIPF